MGLRPTTAMILSFIVGERIGTTTTIAKKSDRQYLVTEIQSGTSL
jgi:hypothetical protein